MSRPAPNLVRELLDYDPETGALRWKQRDPSFFNPTRTHSAEHVAAKWNGKWAGKLAFTSIGDGGYRAGNILGYSTRARRVIWAWMTGEWPTGEIDHRDGDKLNNRWLNFRDVSTKVNSQNASIGSRNTSGAVGVYRHPTATWIAMIGVDGRSIYLGAFKTFDAARAARRAAEREHGFEINNRRDAPGPKAAMQ
jgi:hypothetical protein